MSFSQQLYPFFKYSLGINTDTRTLKPGQIFWALKGDNFNGNLFANQAIEKGASVLVVSEEVDFQENVTIFKVNDTLKALQEFANYHRNMLQTPIMGITGSNGKTTTKELIREVLSTQKNVFVTPGNFNNHIGLPLSLLQITENHELAILEMGDNHPKEIAELCAIAEPDSGLITNIGKDHIGHYKDLSENAATKLELFDYLIENRGFILVNVNDEYLKSSEINAELTYGIDGEIKGEIIDNQLNGITVEIKYKEWSENLIVHSHLAGAYNLENLLAATSVGIYFDISQENIKKGLENYQPSNNRSQFLKKGKFEIVLDAYNANPSSMEVALNSLAQFKPKRIALVLGDMLELGENAEEEHNQLGQWVKSFEPAVFIGIGPQMKNAVLNFGKNGYHFENVQIAKNQVLELVQDCEILLLKGSRGIAVEKIIDQFS